MKQEVVAAATIQGKLPPLGVQHLGTLVQNAKDKTPPSVEIGQTVYGGLFGARNRSPLTTARPKRSVSLANWTAGSEFAPSRRQRSGRRLTSRGR